MYSREFKIKLFIAGACTFTVVGAACSLGYGGFKNQSGNGLRTETRVKAYIADESTSGDTQATKPDRSKHK